MERETEGLSLVLPSPAKPFHPQLPGNRKEEKQLPRPIKEEQKWVQGEDGEKEHLQRDDIHIFHPALKTLTSTTFNP